MAAKNGKSSVQLQEFVKGQLVEAQKRFSSLEEEAQRVLGNLIARGRESRKELEVLVSKLNAGELHLLENETVKDLTKRAGVAGSEVRKRVGELQTRVVEAAGVASQSQVHELGREVTRLAKKVEALITKKGAKSEMRA